MKNEELYEEHKSDPHAGWGNSDSDRLINLERERLRREGGHYGARYEQDKAEYLRQKAEDRGHAGN